MRQCQARATVQDSGIICCNAAARKQRSGPKAAQPIYGHAPQPLVSVVAQPVRQVVNDHGRRLAVAAAAQLVPRHFIRVQVTRFPLALPPPVVQAPPLAGLRLGLAVLVAVRVCESGEGKGE